MMTQQTLNAISDYILTPRDRFHTHLDSCPQCRGNPFNPCPVGALLLSLAVRETSRELERSVPCES